MEKRKIDSMKDIFDFASFTRRMFPCARKQRGGDLKPP